MRLPSLQGVLEERLFSLCTLSNGLFKTSVRQISRPFFLSIQSNFRDLSFSMAVTRKSFSPITIGEACPLPSIGSFHTRLSGSDHLTGVEESIIVPSPLGPRQPGQSSANEGVEKFRAIVGSRTNREIFLNIFYKLWFPFAFARTIRL